jgi:hypothetical protein
VIRSKDRPNRRAYVQAVLKEYVWLPGTRTRRVDRTEASRTRSMSKRSRSPSCAPRHYSPPLGGRCARRTSARSRRSERSTTSCRSSRKCSPRRPTQVTSTTSPASSTPSRSARSKRYRLGVRKLQFLTAGNS